MKKQIIEDFLNKVSKGSNNPEGFKKSPCADDIRKALSELLEDLSFNK